MSADGTAPAIDLYLYRNDAGSTRTRIRQVEQGGFDGLFVGETSSDPYLSLTLAAADSDRATLGTSIALAFPRSPMTTAVAAWDLQRASGGRFVLGLGSQVRKHVERRFSAPFERPAARLADYVRAVKASWSAFSGERPLEHHGEFYTLDFLPEMVRPAPLDGPPPPIYLAAVGATMFRNAATVADGALVHPMHTLDYLREVIEPAIAGGLERAGRERPDFALSITTLAIVAESDTEAERDAVRAQFAFYASTPAYRPILELHGWGGTGDRLHELVRAGSPPRDLGAAVPDEVLDAFCVVADTWPAAITAAREKYRGVADRVMFQAPVPPDITVPR
ncbi:TIGR03617 family F420-dependent LLM class oxidoreductase [Actinomycetospora chiangmaiensis]|uniref:TIGR03617 family F420-dependent LLM class oxidoreductase n=1 Tax=Actinomycetospora chiangmaiensis TaxID=402650 RepID=UPI00036B20A6|nr:TIGR03617 family F420-dependent LLM class oxidoreductase [Actinomycetospora chiangmaiensis]